MDIVQKQQHIYRVFVALAVLNITLTVIGAFVHFYTIPWRDMWDGYLNFFIKISDGDWTAWWAQHNEHRILLAHLLFWLDLAYFKGNAVFLIVINYLLVVGEFWVLYFCLSERLPSSDQVFTKRVLAMLMLAMLFSWIQSANLVWGFQCQFFLAQLLPLTAFYLLHKSHLSTSHSTELFMFACVAGMASLGSMANGILALPLMVLLASILRMSLQRIALLIALSVLGFCAYFYNYQIPPDHDSLKMTLLEAPLDFLQYVVLFLGNPFYFITGKGSVLISEFAGVFIIGSSLFFAHQSLRGSKPASLQLALLTFILYVCISAAIIAVGRVGIRRALTGRYLAPTIIAWLSLLILYAPTIHKKIVDAKSHVLWYLLAIPLFLLPQQFKALRSEPENTASYNLAVLSLTLGVNDMKAVELISPYGKLTFDIAAKAAERKLSVFANPPFSDAYQSLGKIDKERTATTCAGELQEITRVEDETRFFKIRGWLESTESTNTPKYIRILDQQGTTVGFALTGFTNNNAIAAQKAQSRYSGFAGYMLAAQAGQTIILSGKNPGCKLLALAPLPSPDAL